MGWARVARYPAYIDINIRRLSLSSAPFSGAPGEIRTPDPLVRSQMLYPIELRAQLLTGKWGKDEIWESRKSGNDDSDRPRRFYHGWGQDGIRMDLRQGASVFNPDRIREIRG